METITVKIPTTDVDRCNNATPDWSDTTDTDIEAIVYPRSSSEDNELRSALISGLTVLLPPDAPAIPHTARVEARGRTWEVDGDDGDWKSPWGWEPGREVNLREVKG